MPVVLVEVGGVARSGHEYDDRTGVSYEYPAGRYEKWIQPGEPFVYQVPGMGYVGTGIIGGISAAGTQDRLTCEVLAVRMFIEPVPLKAPDGAYYEADTRYWRGQPYWGQGVRPLSLDRLGEILSRVDTSVDISGDAIVQTYASPTDAHAIELYSVGVAKVAMKKRFGVPIVEMPHSNPGFDLLVGGRSEPIRYVEVKGTRSSAPRFFLSEGERRFSERHSSRYTLVVVSGISLEHNSHTGVHSCDGEISVDNTLLAPYQWRASLIVGP